MRIHIALALAIVSMIFGIILYFILRDIQAIILFITILYCAMSLIVIPMLKSVYLKTKTYEEKEISKQEEANKTLEKIEIKYIENYLRNIKLKKLTLKN